jgi:radical SAM protein with 4Fe4S-binding SPASM domain
MPEQINSKTCPAFFLDATIDPAGSYSPCTALGGGVFKFGNQSFKTIWLDNKLQDARTRSAEGQELAMCNRCWSEEKVEFKSEREYLKEDVPAGLDYTDPGYYRSGPRHLNIKVSNICNLRCRTCQSKDSYLYHIEGEFYEKKYNIINTAYTIDKFKKNFTDAQLDELFEFSTNLERIELYGGEPFLDDQVPKFLLRLVNEGRSQHIDLSVSTNTTHPLTDTWRTILSNFKNVIVNISIDGIGDKFTYMRHPGKWEVSQVNVKDLIVLEHECHNVHVVPVITVSALNVWYINEIFDYFKPLGLDPFIIMVQWPQYYCVNVLPEDIKLAVAEHLQSFNNPAFDSIIKLMNTEPRPYSKRSTLSPWEEFKFWTREKDAYRKEDFIATFPGIGKLLVANGHW